MIINLINNFWFISLYLFAHGSWMLFSLHFVKEYNAETESITRNIRELSWMSYGVMRYLRYRSYLISIEFSFHFGFFWYSSFVINFPRFFKRLFRPMKILLLRHSQNNYQIWLCKLNLMCGELSCQIINTSAVTQVVFCYY